MDKETKYALLQKPVAPKPFSRAPVSLIGEFSDKKRGGLP